MATFYSPSTGFTWLGALVNVAGGGVNTAQTYTPPAGANFMWVNCTIAKLYITTDGTTPTATVHQYCLPIDGSAIIPITEGDFANGVKVIGAAGAGLNYRWGSSLEGVEVFLGVA